MNSTMKYFSQAELALASYSTLPAGIPDPLKLQGDGQGLSAKEAELFAEKYSVITQYNDTLAEGGLGTGLSATVFVDNSTHQLTLAIRGTELADSRDLSTGAVMLTAGVAYDQVVALYNWWSRESAVPGTQVKQYRLTSSSQDPQAIQLGNQGLELAGTVSATGGLLATLAADPDRKLEVTGHSLGGHLAMAFGTLFAGFTTQATVFNAPGFKDNPTNQAFFAALGGSVPAGGPIVNVIADEANVGSNPFDIVAGANSRPGVAIDIAIESQFGSDESNPPAAKNHSQQTLTDSLAVYALLSQLDPNLSAASYKNILHAAAAGTAASLERLVDTIERLFDIDSELMPSGNGNRDSLYQAIDRIQNGSGKAKYDSLVGNANIISLTSASIGTLIQGASQNDVVGLAYRYALTALNPFVVLGADYSSDNADGALDLYNPTTGMGAITTQYVADSAKFLVRKAWFNIQDIAPVNPGYQHGSTDNVYQNDDTLFIDQASGYAMAQGFVPSSPFANIHRYYFGDERDNTYTGGSVSDHLYGGLGYDVIDGGAGNDYLEGGGGSDDLTGGTGDDILLGGTGEDTYIFASGDGWDWIEDQDGAGKITYDGMALTGGDRQGTGNLWTKTIDEKLFAYVLYTG